MMTDITIEHIMEVNFVTGKVIQTHLIDPLGRAYLFRRSDGSFWGPVSGGVRVGESILEAVLREILEETAINICIESVFVPKFAFKAKTLKSKKTITIFPVVAHLPFSFSSSNIRLNGELSDFQHLDFDSALRILALRGTSEAHEGFIRLVSKVNLIEGPQIMINENGCEHVLRTSPYNDMRVFRKKDKYRI